MGEIDGAFRSWGFSRGRHRSHFDAIADAAREAGVEIRTKAPVGKILVKNGRAAGVILQSGEETLRQRRFLQPSTRISLSKNSRAQRIAWRFSRRCPPLQISRLVRPRSIWALDALPNFKCFRDPVCIFAALSRFLPAWNTWSAAYDDAK